jgi:hypothetical protein
MLAFMLFTLCMGLTSVDLLTSQHSLPIMLGFILCMGLASVFLSASGDGEKGFSSLVFALVGLFFLILPFAPGLISLIRTICISLG